MPVDENTPEGDFVIQATVRTELVFHARKLNENGGLVEQKRTLPKGFGIAMVVFELHRLA